MSESTQSDFEDQGPKIIGTIQYLDKEDIGIDTSNVSNVDKVKVYQSDLSFETISKLNEIRGLNSLEKPLTPVHSYNDESLVFQPLILNHLLD